MESLEEILESLSNMTQIPEPFIFDATNIDGVFKYLRTIDWSEKWLWGLISFHVATFLSIVISRRCSHFQIVLFFLLLILISSAERLNELGSKYWKSFANEQYFDSNGLFISVVLSAPILLNTSLIVILWLYETYQMLIKLIKIKKGRQAAAKKKDEPSKKDD